MSCFVNEKFENWVEEQLNEIINVELLDGIEFGNLCTIYAENEDFDTREYKIAKEIEWIARNKPSIYKSLPLIQE